MEDPASNSARPRGFEPTVKSASSRAYATIDGDGRAATRPADASSDVSTGADPHDGGDANPKPLPPVTAELFVAAGGRVAERLTREHAAPALLDEVFHRVVDQCAALRVSGG